ncbi:MAG: Mur ligase family protein [Candidatus Colwellbacteria bacterium]
MSNINKITSFKEAYDFLVSAVPKTSAAAFKGEGGFIKSKRWLEKLGNVQDNSPAIHIAGTSGKGTVAYLISALLEAHGKKTVLITSPHAYDIRERIRVGQEKLSEEDFIELINDIMPDYMQMKEAGAPPSYFEVLAAMGFMAGAKRRVDYCVVETGVGGKLDTSNTITRDDKVCVITPIGYDHMHILGNTLTEIATQKIGIAHANQRVFSAGQDPEAMRVIERACNELGAQLSVVDMKSALGEYELPLDLSTLNPQLSGVHGSGNVSLALEVVQYVAKRDGWDIDRKLIHKALGAFKIPGRFEIVKIGDKEFVFDGAHNEQKMAALVAALRGRYKKESIGFVFASSRDEPSKKLDLIEKEAEVVILTKYHSEELDMIRPQPNLEQLADGKKFLYIPEAKDVVSYIKSSDLRVWVVTGSFYILGEIKDLST